MATIADAAGDLALDGDIDQNISPLESAGTCSTPDTEISSPSSPVPKTNKLERERAWARRKLAVLTQEEKVVLNLHTTQL